MEFQINRPIIGSPDVDEYNAAILRTLENVTKRVPGLNQWRFIIEEWIIMEWENDTLIWLFDVSPAAGKGDECAAAKIATLACFPEIANTGELYDRTLSDQENLDKLMSQTGEPLVPWYGGVRLRLTDFTLSASDEYEDIIKTENNELRVAFSGARQDADALFAIAAIMTVNKTFAKLHPEAYTHYDFEPLEKDPVTGFALNILR